MSKKKKEKITYIDDGRTIADMSGISGGPRLSGNQYGRPRSSAKEIWKTYLGAVKMMFFPMLLVICGIIIIYMILSFVFLLL